MEEVSEVRAVPGRGLEGDRYFDAPHSPGGAVRASALTLIEVEALAADRGSLHDQLVRCHVHCRVHRRDGQACRSGRTQQRDRLQVPVGAAGLEPRGPERGLDVAYGERVASLARSAAEHGVMREDTQVPPQ
jgi:hypothetical protein